MSVIKDAGFLEIGKCYKKAVDATYLGKYRGIHGGEARWGAATDYAVFEKENLLPEEINVIQVPCQAQQQWLTYTQLVVGRCYVDQNRVYLGKYSGSNNAYFDSQQYAIVHRFEKLMLAGVNWNFLEVPCQAGGKRSSLSGKRSSLSGKRSSLSGKRKTRKH